MDLKKIAALAVAAVMTFGASGCKDGSGSKQETAQTTAAAETAEAEKPAIRDMTTAEIVKEMGVGINLGNTFEACGSWISSSGGVKSYETAWGSPVITEDMIKGYKNAGFGVLRVPVAWSNLMAEDYTISPEYLERVDEVTGWALDCGLYVIMNIHYDGGWWENFPTDTENCMKKYTRVWEQLSDYYGKYDDRLMFESLNEEGGWNSMWNRWSGTNGEEKQSSYDLLNRINQKFVDVVRASGGNNEKRHLLIAGYQTDCDLTCDPMFRMPDDPARHCAVSVHYYTPSTFCILDSDADWGKARKTWGRPKDIEELEKYMDMLKTTFADKGIPVIIGEYGCVAVKNKEPEQIRNFNLLAAEEAFSRGLCPVLWDITGVFYDRYSCTMKDAEFESGLRRIAAGEDIKDEIMGFYSDGNKTDKEAA